MNNDYNNGHKVAVKIFCRHYYSDLEINTVFYMKLTKCNGICRHFLQRMSQITNTTFEYVVLFVLYLGGP
jgi:hypothetical protein